MLSLACVAASVVYLIPVLWMLSLSVRSTSGSYSTSLLPGQFIPGNYVTAWRQSNFGVLVLHSLVITGVTVIGTLTLSVTAAYGLAHARGISAGLVVSLLVVGLMIPPAVIIVPFFLVAHNLGLYNTLFGVIVAEIAFALPLAVVIFRGYVRNIPREIHDSARVDGARELRAFWSVILPLLRPATATVAMLTALSTWNDFLLPLVMLANTDSSTVTVGMSQFSGGLVSMNLQYTAADASMAIVPLVAVFLFGRKYFVQGLTAGALRE